MLTYYILARLATKRPKWVPKKEPKMPPKGVFFLWEVVLLIILGLSVLWTVIGSLLGMVQS